MPCSATCSTRRGRHELAPADTQGTRARAGAGRAFARRGDDPPTVGGEGDVPDLALVATQRATTTAVRAVEEARRRKGKVIAVGTTVVRALESAASGPGTLRAYRGETGLFIRPGYPFQMIDALLTNFHLPQTTLLMLVSAFAGTELLRQAYAEAVRMRYRFYSYGDAMFVTGRQRPASRAAHV